MRRLIALTAFLVVGPPAAALEPGASAEEIRQCVDANLPLETSVQTVVFRAHDRMGAITEAKATIYWRKFEDGFSRVLIRFFAPPDLRGAGVLLLERSSDDRHIFMYLPALDKVKRITKHMVAGSMFGTDFSYEDFERFVDYSGKAGVARMDDAVVDGEKTFVLESRPVGEDASGYKRIVEYIDPKTCVRLKTELFEAGDKLRKVASSDRSTVRREKELWYAPSLLLRDLRDETHTELVIEKVEIGVEIPKKLFSQSDLTRGH
jgi:outer membrane lipoprotein-sorting protein